MYEKVCQFATLGMMARECVVFKRSFACISAFSGSRNCCNESMLCKNHGEPHLSCFCNYGDTESLEIMLRWDIFVQKSDTFIRLCWETAREIIQVSGRWCSRRCSSVGSRWIPREPRWQFVFQSSTVAKKTTPLHCNEGKSEQRLEQKFSSEVDAIETWLQYWM